MTKNQIEYWKNVETERHNRETEAQNQRALVLQMQALQNERERTRISASSQAETARSNLAREEETQRSNLASEAINLLRHEETVRANKAGEAIGRVNAGANVTSANAAKTQAETGQKQQSETVRHNYVTEYTQRNINPWVSISTTLGQIIPRAADKVTTIVTNLKSNIAYSYNQPRSVVKPVSSYNR